jgi:hypothetical protein
MRYAPSPWIYGAPSSNSLGCPVEIVAEGAPSLGSNLPFRIDAPGTPSHRSGMLLWSHSPAEIPFAGGALLLRPPVQRTLLQDSGGTPGVLDCSGRLSFDFNALLAAGGSGLSAGSYAFAQFWYRDPGSPGATALSAGLRFRIDP